MKSADVDEGKYSNKNEKSGEADRRAFHNKSVKVAIKRKLLELLSLTSRKTKTNKLGREAIEKLTDMIGTLKN